MYKFRHYLGLLLMLLHQCHQLMLHHRKLLLLLFLLLLLLLPSKFPLFLPFLSLSLLSLAPPAGSTTEKVLPTIFWSSLPLSRFPIALLIFFSTPQKNSMACSRISDPFAFSIMIISFLAAFSSSTCNSVSYSNCINSSSNSSFSVNSFPPSPDACIFFLPNLP